MSTSEPLKLKTVKVGVPVTRQRKTNKEIVTTLQLHLPLPPSLDEQVPAEKVEELSWEVFAKELRDVETGEYKVTSNDDKDQWLARAMKRNPEITALFERIRPLSQSPSFSSRVIKVNGPAAAQQATSAAKETQKKLNKDFTGIISSTEAASVISKEILLQLIHQHLATKGHYKTIQMLEKESGIKAAQLKTEQSYLRTLLEMGIANYSNVYALPYRTVQDLNLDAEVEIPINTRTLDDEFAADYKVRLWDELASQDEGNIEIDADKSIRAGTLNKLIEKLTDHQKADFNFTKTFLITYRSFADPQTLLEKLLERYDAPDLPIRDDIFESQWEQMKNQIRLRTVNTISTWIDNFFTRDWNHQLILRLAHFIDEVLLKSDIATMVHSGIKLRQKLAGKVTTNKKGTGDVFFAEAVPEPRVPADIFWRKLDIYDLDDIEIARQFTIREHKLYKQIEPSELLDQAWNKAKLKHRAPNVLEMITRFNIVANWVTCQILEPKSLRDRRNRVVRLMNIAKQLHKLNNFATLFAFISGTQNAAVHRLKHTFEEVPKAIKEEFQEMVNLMSTDGNYACYRRKLLSCQGLPIVPFIGFFLTDLTFTDDGNKNFISSKKRPDLKLINWKKYTMIYKIIQQIQDLQMKPFDLYTVHQIQELLGNLFDNFNMKNDTELFNMSLEREPRGAEKSDIVP